MALGPFSERWRTRTTRGLRVPGAAGRLWRVLALPERPHVAVEVRPGSIGIVRTRRDKGARALASAAEVELSPDLLQVSLTQANFADAERFRFSLRAALERAGELDAARIALVLPDPVARIAVVPAAELPAGRTREMDEMVRFRMRKSLPFDVREARVTQVRSERAGDPVLVVAAMASVLDAYEDACRSLGLEPGLVEVAGLALCRACVPSGAPGDRLLVNWDQGYVTLILLRGGWPILVRTLAGAVVTAPAEVAREAAQTQVYARERLASPGFEQVLVRSAALPIEDAVGVLEGALGTTPDVVDPWRALGTADPGPAGQALAGAAASLGAPQ